MSFSTEASGAVPSPFHRIKRCALITFIFLTPAILQAYQILFYYNGLDKPGSAVLQCADLLRKAGNQVTVIDVGGVNRNPKIDSWGPPYDQVWDMRFVESDKTTCGKGSPVEADYFDKRWRVKAEDYLSRCGRLFIAGEHYQLADRNEGLYRFLKEIQAVKRGYDDCPPSRNGNSSTDLEAFYPVRGDLGPVSFFGAYVGGIPVALLNGTSFVDTQVGWQDDDGVERSVVSGWEGDQLKGAVHSPPCARGKLFMVWDASMWTLEALPAVAGSDKRNSPIWNESSWFSWNSKKNKTTVRDIKKAKEATEKFFTAAAHWLGSGKCPCEAPAEMSASDETASKERMPLALKQGITRNQGPNTIVGNILQPLRHNSTPPGIQTTFQKPTASPAAPQTIVFNTPPVYIYMRFKDGPGEYKLDIFDSRGNHVRVLFDQTINQQTEEWASWNGVNETGQLMPQGNYTAVFTKDGRALRKITLIWVLPGR